MVSYSQLIVLVKGGQSQANKDSILPLRGPSENRLQYDRVNERSQGNAIYVQKKKKRYAESKQDVSQPNWHKRDTS